MKDEIRKLFEDMPFNDEDIPNEELLEATNIFIKEHPDEAEAYFLRAKFYMALKKPEEAIKDLNKAIALNPLEYDSHLERGLTYHELKEYKKAINDFSKCIEIEPQKPEGYFNRAISYSHNQQDIKAIADYQSAIDLNYKIDEAYNNIAEIKMHDLEDYEGAYIDFKKSLEIDNQNTSAYYNMGCMSLKEEKYSEAIGYFTKLIEQDPEDSWGYFLRGVAKINLKMKKEAQLDLEKAREIAPHENFKFEDYASTL